MNKRQYLKTVRFFKNNSTARTILAVVYKILPNLILLSYPILLIFAWILGTKDFLITLILPASIFGLVTVLRVLINEQRPYERYKVKSVFDKKTVGKSMPSRHTASAFIISMVALRLEPILGISLLTLSVLITASRVLAGVHYIRDVLVSIALSIGSAVIIFSIFTP